MCFAEIMDGGQFTRSLLDIAARPLSPPQQHVPRAAEGCTQPHRRRDQDIGLPGFDLLKRADIEVRHFSQRFLSYLPRHAFPAQISTECRKRFG